MPGSIRRARAGARQDAGLTLVETLVAATLLLIGALGTFALLDAANATTAASRAREGATNIAREVLEDSRSVAYTKIGQPNWLQSQLQGLAGGSGAVSAPSAFAERTTVDRRGIAYTVTVTPCSVDDSRDGYGAHPGARTARRSARATGSRRT
jgi:type II secretory pathway pseudopilin PulG